MHPGGLGTPRVRRWGATGHEHAPHGSGRKVMQRPTFSATRSQGRQGIT